MNTLQLWFTHLNEETLSVLSFLILGVFTALVAYWVFNRRKYQQLAHQIPASVVKNYLDSIIQNSSALKSSLFRGGGLELGDGVSVPSVRPVQDLPTGGGTISSEELGQKNAEIASLKAQVGDKNQVITDLEAQLESAKLAASAESSGIDPAEVEKLNGEINSLKEQLASAPTGSGDSEEITKERDELKSRLAEYEIIEDDLANLKKLQQENEQLKAALAKGGGSAPAAEEVAAAEEPVAAAEEPASPAPAEVSGETAAAAEEVAAKLDNVQDVAPASKEADVVEGQAAGEDGKSAEDLLSEFEKMLG